MSGVGVDAARCRAALTPGIFAADRATALVAEGLPFREAYRRVKDAPAAAVADPMSVIRRRTSTGAPGNLALDVLTRRRRRSWEKEWKSRRTRFHRALSALLGDQ